MALGPVQRTLQATRLFCSASAFAIALCWAGASNATEINSTCAYFTPERRALFGDYTFTLRSPRTRSCLRLVRDPMTHIASQAVRAPHEWM
jgi:hypothetical protein